MRGRTTLSIPEAAIELVPDNYLARLDLAGVFGSDAPVEVDLGCGDGAYLVQLAERNPGRNFLGIERLIGRVRSACRKIAQRDLTNARVLLIETTYAVEYLLPAEGIAAFHLLFPDPWPKRRHHTRRVVNEHFLKVTARALAPRGVLRIVTDQREYFESIRSLAAGNLHRFKMTDEDIDAPTSTFEQRFRATGAPIYRLILRKISDER